MGGSVFFFVESKSFEFSIEEGGMFYQLRIYERGRDSLRSIFMGKGSAKRLLLNVDELISGKSRGQLAKSFREGDKCFILQLGSNTYSAFLLISKLINGRRKGSLVVPEGKSGSGWRGFGLHLRKVLDSESLAPKQVITGFPKRDATKSFASVVARNRKTNGGGGDKGKNKTDSVQNTNTCKENLLGQREQSGVKILSVPSRNSELPARKVVLDRGSNLGRRLCQISAVRTVLPAKKVL